MNKIKLKIRVIALATVMFSIFNFASLALASGTYSGLWPLYNGSYQMKGRDYVGILFGNPMWQTITTSNWYYNYAQLVNDPDPWYQSEQSCDYDLSYVFLTNSYSRASFKHFAYPSSRKTHEVEDITIYMFVSPMFESTVHNGDRLFIRYKDGNGVQHEYQGLTSQSGQNWTFSDGVTGSIYLDDDGEHGIYPAHSTDYYFAYFTIDNINEFIDVNTIEAGFQNGQNYASGNEARITCTEMVYTRTEAML